MGQRNASSYSNASMAGDVVVVVVVVVVEAVHLIVWHFFCQSCSLVPFSWRSKKNIHNNKEPKVAHLLYCPVVNDPLSSQRTRRFPYKLATLMNGPKTKLTTTTTTKATPPNFSSRIRLVRKEKRTSFTGHSLARRWPERYVTYRAVKAAPHTHTLKKKEKKEKKKTPAAAPRRCRRSDLLIVYIRAGGPSFESTERQGRALRRRPSDFHPFST